MKPNLDRAGSLLVITLALPLALIILAVISRSIGPVDATVAFFMFCTVSVCVSFAAGVGVPIWMAIVWRLGGNVERRRVGVLLLLSVLNIAVALMWIFVVVPKLRFRW